ncbi:ABC transporter permease [Leptospira mayottensis]|uniref:ABC transporter permease n=1 Tax=Leptospira mayottensis TaxID=1137606 RepID=A0ABN5NT60_9LEPT|nr:ABC transporter permease [Leptospira mayottensis]AXR60218.1 ABC transporter permease [Leptospira mayottensis]AXR63530.1 ABC transporter permease [Leptospira mayottensis]AXR67769.1 ABC transporter permease [Leptospira mayottensis]AZQ03360.1 ABC transporter permease [Leptospira mayottensis 200901116]TGN14424.1 ABC transporter permease [Leptospira mayottensis]
MKVNLFRGSLIFLITSRYIRGSRVAGLLSLKSRLSFIVMTVGVSLLIVVLSIFNGFQRQVKESLWQGGPHITVENKFDSGDIQNYEKIIVWIRKNPYLKDRIVSIGGSITSHGLIQNANSFIPIMVRALPVENIHDLIANRLTNFPRIVHHNREEIEKYNIDNQVLIGKEMAGLYDFNLGANLTMAVPGGRFSLGKGVDVSIKTFRTVGFFKTGYYNYDTHYVFLSLPVAQKFFNLKNSVNQIAIKVRSLDDLQNCKREILKEFRDPEFENEIGYSASFSVRTIAEEQENFFTALKLEKTIISIIVFLFIILAALGMVASVYSLVRAKRKSIGVLKALGLPSSGILLIFTLNAMVVGVLASLVGGVSGIFIASNLETIVNGVSELINMVGFYFYHSEWTNIELVPKDVYYFDHIPVDVDISFIFMVTTAATILSGIAGYFPARWAAGLNPVDTIRND